MVSRCHRGDIQVGHLELVAGSDDGALPGAERVVGGKELGGDDAVVRVRLTVIVEVADGELPGDFEQRAHVIAVVMSGPEVIDFGDARGPERVGDAPEIPVAAVTGVHQQRLAGRANKQRRLPAFRVDVIDGQGSGPDLCGEAQSRDDQTTGRDNDSAHA